MKDFIDDQVKIYYKMIKDTALPAVKEVAQLCCRAKNSATDEKAG